MLSQIRIKKLDHVVVRARDLEKMIAFYCDVLGCSLVKRSTAVAGLVHLHAGDSFIDIMQGGESFETPPGVSGNMDHFCIQIDSFTEAEMTEYLKSHDVEIGEFGRRFGADGDGLSVYLRDPEGNEVELKASPN